MISEKNSKISSPCCKNFNVVCFCVFEHCCKSIFEVLLVCWLCVMSTTLVHHGYRMWFCHCWECWSSWWTISMWKCGPQHFIFKHGKCALRNYNFIEKWNIATCSYINSSCILKTTPSTFHLLGVFCCEWQFTCGFWKPLNVAMYVVVVYCDKYFFVPKFCFEERFD